jgi:valyl-tRNA synthetase
MSRESTLMIAVEVRNATHGVAFRTGTPILARMIFIPAGRRRFSPLPISPDRRVRLTYTLAVDQPAGRSLPTSYTPAEVEGSRHERWIRDRAKNMGSAAPSCVVLPRPNVAGPLRLMHILDHTIQDSLVRRIRMRGYGTLWRLRLDEAGITTQNAVERHLAGEGLSRLDLGRDQFVERVWQWTAETRQVIERQMRRLGATVDWSRGSAPGDHHTRAVHSVFKRLFDDGLIYRAERITNWCPRCLTALSDLEVEHTDDEGDLVSIKYGDGSAAIVVATTRPETMLGDMAIVVHPDDDRYANLVGHDVEVPLTGRRIPILADAQVDPTFGTGAVKVTPAHDPGDFEMGQRHGLARLSILDERGVITAHGPFQGLDRFEARPAIVAALREQGRVVARRHPYRHAVGHCSCCHATVEPRLSVQWFVNTAPLARAAADAVRDGRVRIVPVEFAKRYLAALDTPHEWCVSRQLWWGHRIPVWYGPEGQAVCPGPDEKAPHGDGWHREPDVLDMWFSSAVWPLSTVGWPDRTTDSYPAELLVTGQDDLVRWVARMMMIGLHVIADSSFRTVAVHGAVRDERGARMSASTGNAVDPVEWFDRFGADATRLALARGAHLGADVTITPRDCRTARNFCTKLWNLTRFAQLRGAIVDGDLPAPARLTDVDRWILAGLQRVIAEVDEEFERVNLARACETLVHFVRDDVCDWYVELIKPALTAPTRRVLGHVLDVLLRLLHPAIPFVTDELWCALTGRESVLESDWPIPDSSYVDYEAERPMAVLRTIATEVRRVRSEQAVQPGRWVGARLIGLAGAGLAGCEQQLRHLLRLYEPTAQFIPTATLSMAGRVVVELDTRGAVDTAALGGLPR